MSKTNKIIIVVLLVAALLLGIGYAAIQNITLNITGTAAADPSQANFKVMFTGTPEVSDGECVTATITDDTNATINVSGLTKKGDVASATYIVQNVSEDLSADLSVATSNSNTEFFTVTSELYNNKTSLVAGEATTLTVTVELIKTPLEDSVSSIVGVQLTAIPVQPGEEGTSGSDTPGQVVPDEGLAACGIEGHYVGDGRGEHGIAVENCSNSHTYTCECEGWTVPEGGTYTMPNAANKTVYTEGEHLPCGYETVERRYI